MDMIARYPAVCPLCHCRINPGFDPITREPDGGRRWVHALCLESVTVHPDQLDAELAELVGG